MVQKLRVHIEQQLPFLKGKKLLIAISGGIDSVVMTHLLHHLDHNIALAHCNFQLRDNESNLDEAFVRTLGKNLSLETHVIQFDTKDYASQNKLSIQISARELRYDWFKHIANTHNYDYVLTAHHADDNLETFLINLTRGSGLKGLTGIPEQNGHIIRPLLTFSQEDIFQYAKQESILWREDKSNSETKYVRNKIRHEILPKLKEINKDVLRNFSKTIENLKESEQIITDRIIDVSNQLITYEGDYIKISVQEIEKLSKPKAYLYFLLKKYGFNQWEDITNILCAQSGKKILTKTHILLKNRDFLVISSIKKSNDNVYTISEKDDQINEPLQLKLSRNTIIENKKAILVDQDLVSFPLILRKKREGDFFYPTGMSGKKKISKYFKDIKLSAFEKQETWVLCSNKNEIIWIVGMRQDRRFIATPKTIKTINILF